MRSCMAAISFSRVAALKAEVPRVPKPPALETAATNGAVVAVAHATEHDRMVDAEQIANARVNHGPPRTAVNLSVNFDQCPALFGAPMVRARLPLSLVRRQRRAGSNSLLQSSITGDIGAEGNTEGNLREAVARCEREQLGDAGKALRWRAGDNQTIDRFVRGQ